MNDSQPNPPIQPDPSTDSGSAQPNMPPAEPGIDQVYRYMMFGLSLPERAARSTAALLSGAVNESAELLVPRAFQDSKTYNTFVKQMLNMMANDVGGVKAKEKNTDGETAESENVKSTEEQKVAENYVAKKDRQYVRGSRWHGNNACLSADYPGHR